jgi:glyceraldehyde-3-phosphate dehydrogenase/erythrose-4-phosphate dehydrogenase
MARVAINGLGRIGRATLKIMMDTPRLDLVAAKSPPLKMSHVNRPASQTGPHVVAADSRQ